MAGRRTSASDSEQSRRRPATTPDGRERQLISAAVDLAERQILEGTASSQVITHYLKLGSSRERLEQARLGEEVSLLQIKAEQLASEKRVEQLYKDALDAMRGYTGQEPLDVPDDEYYGD